MSSSDSSRKPAKSKTGGPVKKRVKSTKQPVSRRRSSTSANGTDAAPERPLRIRAKDVVAELPSADLKELFRFWAGKESHTIPSAEDTLKRRVLAWIDDPEVLGARVASLGRRLASILEVHLNAPRYQCTVTDLINSKALSYLSSYDLKASLMVLERHALIVGGSNTEVARYGVEVTAMPHDIAENLLRARRTRERGIFDAFTLRGHLDKMYEDPARAARTPASRVREMYKMYSNETAAVARIERLPEGLRHLVEKTVLEFGGLLPRGLFDRMDTELPHWNGKRWGKILEESLVGTVARLELSPHGIAHNDSTLIVFNEVALAWLRHVAVPGDPDAPHDEAGLGVDLVSNISRFIGFIIEHDVRFTVRGEIFKTTEKRIIKELIPNPGRELTREEVLEFIYAFSRESTLIKSTGERTFALTNTGREWGNLSLVDKLERLIDFACEERGLGGEYFHQARMRRIFMRMLKRIEPTVWYDLMYVPFLARNTHLASLDDREVEDFFAEKSQSGHYAAREDLQRMAWNLVSWVRKRLYLFGIVDLGYDKSGHPVAMKLTRIGAELLGMYADDDPKAVGVGTLVVTPDFEVVLFPTGDDASLVHDLDRFCGREKAGHLFQFKLTDRTVHRALSQGMRLSRMIATLEENSRTPVPQNVIVSIRGWAARAGLLFLSEDLKVSSDNPDTLAAFAADPGVRQYLRGTPTAESVSLKSDNTAGRIMVLIRELGFLIEPEA